MTATLNEIYNCVVDSSVQKIRSLGFVRRGTTFRKVSHGNVAIIEFQRSTKSDRHELLFTINIGIVCGKLIEEEQPPLTRAGSVDAHLRLRIGMLLPERSDKWWQITEETDRDRLLAEVSSLIL